MSFPPIELKSQTRILALTPEDMTVSVEAGLTLGALQAELAKHRQWLPIDPPNAGTTSVHDLLAWDLSGPRRFGYGTIREHLIGMKVALADGRVIKSGGQVVKNVAGYDLAKLFIGARGSLGTIVEATFKLRPLPEVERLIGKTLAVSDAASALRDVLNSELTPVIVDLHRLADPASVTLVVGLAGAREEVDWQLARAAQLGFTADATLHYETVFWQDTDPVKRISVLPTRGPEMISQLGDEPFVARAGNGVIYHRGPAIGPKRVMPVELMRRVKAAYDPKNLLPEFTA
jgi:FAD/FMN-containing dehydrogenase